MYIVPNEAGCRANFSRQRAENGEWLSPLKRQCTDTAVTPSPSLGGGAGGGGGAGEGETLVPVMSPCGCADAPSSVGALARKLAPPALAH